MHTGPAELSAEFQKEKGVVLPAPLGSPTGLGDCSDGGPEAILSALRENRDPRTGELLSRVYLAPALDLGGLDQAQAVDRIQEAVSVWLQRDVFVLLLGGEHTVTLGAARALLARGEDFGVVYLDAHADLKSGVGSCRFTHATVARRLVEEGLRVTGLGWRSFDAREYEFWRRHDLEVCSCADLAPDSARLRQVLGSLPEQVYLSIDVDVLDPAIMPATGAPEPDGISLETLRAVIRKVFAARRVVGADMVELSPLHGKTFCQTTAASLAADLLDKALAQEPARPPGVSVIHLPGLGDGKPGSDFPSEAARGGGLR